MRHAEELDRSDFSPVWSYLADIWDWITTNREYPNALWRFWQKCLSELDTWFEIHKYDFSILSQAYRGSRYEPFPKMITLSADTRVSNDPMDLDYHSYYVDPDIRQLNQLDDSVVKANRMWTRGPAPQGSFTFTTGVHDTEQGILRFHDGSYWDADLISYDDGMPSITLWATIWTGKYSDTMVERFGPFVGYGPARKVESKTYLDILTLWGGQLLGPLLPALESGIYVHNDWPIAPADGIVESISGRHSLTLRVPNGTIVVQNDTGLPWQIELPAGWHDIAVGDEIAFGSLLVKACEVIDRITDPWMWTKYPIGLPETYHTFICAFNGDLPLDTSSGEYEIDWDRVVAFINRNKPIGDKAYYVVNLNASVEITYNATSLQTMRAPLISANQGGVMSLHVDLDVSDMSYALVGLLAPNITSSWLSNTTLSIAPSAIDLSGDHDIGGLPIISEHYTDLGFVI